ncbi:P-loop NTPase [Fusibacter sp. JL298sf-3]
MPSQCDHNCNSCSETCTERLHDLSKIKKVIGVISGKGGVGKSLITSMAAVTMNRRGYKSAIMDADITGPSIPKAFGIKEKAVSTEVGIIPVKSRTDIPLMSLNLLLANESDPVVWRGPMIAGAVKQFWTDVVWGEIDYLFVDMPPGTGDVALTVFQSLPLDGIVIVTSPQELVSMIVTKAVKMAQMMDVPILGLVENMSYFKCDKCDEKHLIYGESHIEAVADTYGLKVLAKLPIEPKFAKACDSGDIESFEGTYLEGLADAIAL